MKNGVSGPAEPTYLQDLHVFCLVVELSSITAAAKQLGESKSLVSRRLSRLERELGVPLLRRNPRMVRPTEFGLAYHRRTKQALQALGDASAALRRDLAPSGPFCIVTSHGFGICVLAPLILEFTERYPDVEVEVVLTDEPPTFSTNQIDVAIYPARALRDTSLKVRRLLDWEIQLVASATYLDRYGGPKTYEDLVHHKLIFGPRPPRTAIRTLSITPGPGMRARRVTISGAVIATNTVFAREAALAGTAIAYVPDFMVERDIAEGRLVQILPECRFHAGKGGMFLLYPAMTFVPSKVRVFCDFIAEALSSRSSKTRAVES